MGKRGSEERQAYCQALEDDIDRQAELVVARMRVFEACYWSHWENDTTGYDHQGQTGRDQDRLDDLRGQWDRDCAGEFPT